MTRLREAESERVALRLVSETAEGIVVTGKIQMHTSTPFAEDVLVGSMNELPAGSGRHLWFIVPVNARGIRVVARRPAVKHENPFLSPLSSRFDELDSMVWLEDVFVPPLPRLYRGTGAPNEAPFAGMLAALAPQPRLARQGGINTEPRSCIG